MTVYFGLNLAYPVGLNDISIVDVLVIAVGFVIRLGAGAVLVEVSLSAWIMICSALLALFLAVAKRRDDVVRALDAGTGPASPATLAPTWRPVFR